MRIDETVITPTEKKLTVSIPYSTMTATNKNTLQTKVDAEEQKGQAVWTYDSIGATIPPSPKPVS